LACLKSTILSGVEKRKKETLFNRSNNKRSPLYYVLIFVQTMTYFDQYRTLKSTPHATNHLDNGYSFHNRFVMMGFYRVIKDFIMLKHLLKKTLTLSSFIVLVSCASVPTDINIIPDLALKEGTIAFSNAAPWQIQSRDLRIERHLVQIVDGEKVAQLINEHQSVRLLIEKNLSQAWLNNGLKIADSSDYHVDIMLNKALATVTESAVSYEVKSQLVLKLQLSHQGKKFVKLFRSNSQWEGPFNASISRITKELSVQLSDLLNQIVQDEELNKKLQQF